VAVGAACISVAAIPSVEASREPKISAVRAMADAHVTASVRNANFGRVRRLTVDGKPVARSYVRFEVENSGGNLRRVNLLLYTHTRSRVGYQIRLVTRRWTERRITFENAPRVSRRYVSSGPVRARAWKAVDVTSLVGGDLDSRVSFALTTAGTSAIEVASRESGLRGPRLVIEREQENPSTNASPSVPGRKGGGTP
jgi:hypothetical protein